MIHPYPPPCQRHAHVQVNSYDKPTLWIDHETSIWCENQKSSKKTFQLKISILRRVCFVLPNSRLVVGNTGYVWECVYGIAEWCLKYFYIFKDPIQFKAWIKKTQSLLMLRSIWRWAVRQLIVTEIQVHADLFGLKQLSNKVT